MPTSIRCSPRRHRVPDAARAQRFRRTMDVHPAIALAAVFVALLQTYGCRYEISAGVIADAEPLPGPAPAQPVPQT